MQPLNYARQLLSYATGKPDGRMSDRISREKITPFVGKIIAATKFLLPDGVGHLMADREFKALDRETELRLPFPLVLIEYPDYESKRSIILAEEGETAVEVTWFIDNGRGWMAGYTESVGRTLSPDAYTIVASDVREVPIPTPFGRNYFVDVVLSLVNMLSCSNVTTNEIHPRKQPKASKGVLPFDSYHVLSVRPPSSGAWSDGGTVHRPPREHLRRGHIRRLPTGKKIWINAVVVNAGIGRSVSKDYRVKAH